MTLFHEAQITHTKTRTPRERDIFFRLSPDPLLRALSNLRASNNPPPPGRREERVSVDLRGAGGGLSCSPVPRAVPLTCYRSFALLISICGRCGAIEMCAVSISSFSRHPLANEREASASATNSFVRRAAWRMCDLPDAMTMTAADMVMMA